MTALFLLKGGQFCVILSPENGLLDSDVHALVIATHIDDITIEVTGIELPRGIVHCKRKKW